MHEDEPSIPVRVLVVYDSWQGHTTRAAEEIAAGAREEGAEAEVKTVGTATLAHVIRADALVLGSAVHQRSMTWPMKRFVDEVCEPAWFHDHVVGRVGAVFTTGGGHGQAGGGAEMCQLGLLANLAACGCVLVPLPKCTPGFEHAGMHWGPTLKTTNEEMVPLDPSALDPEALGAFRHHGANVVRVASRLRGLALARGNRWPTAEVRAAREAADREADGSGPSGAPRPA